MRLTNVMSLHLFIAPSWLPSIQLASEHCSCNDISNNDTDDDDDNDAEPTYYVT